MTNDNDDDKYHYENIEKYLSKILDIERIHRKIIRGILEPASFASLDIGYSLIIQLIKYIEDNCEIVNELLPSSETLTIFNTFIEEYRKDFNLDEIIKYHLNNITTSFFNKGVEPEIDNIQNEIDKCFLFMNSFTNEVIKLYRKRERFYKNR